MLVVRAIAVAWVVVCAGPALGQTVPPPKDEPNGARLKPPAAPVFPQPQAVPGAGQPAIRIRRGAGERRGADKERTVFLADRTILQRLAKARELIGAKQYNEAVRQLQIILDAPEDFFYLKDPQGKKPDFGGVKRETLRILEQMPPAGLESYELQFGAEARQSFEEASSPVDPVGLQEVARRFFKTKAGFEATELLGTYHLDRGDPLPAALCFERLRQSNTATAENALALGLKTALCWTKAGMPERARRVLDELKSIPPGTTVSLGGRTVKFSGVPAQPLEWLTQVAGTQATSDSESASRWLVFGGNPARDSRCLGASPLLQNDWQQSLTRCEVPSDLDPTQNEEVDVAPLLQLGQQGYQDAGIPLLPSGHPLIVDSVVIARTYSRLKAFELTTGREIWQSSEGDRAFDTLNAGHFSLVPQESGQPNVIAGLLQQRATEDNTFGTLSSDGELLFSVEDLVGVGSLPNYVQQDVRRLVARNYNRLVAQDVRSGRLIWEAGGPRVEYGLDLAGCFFLGAPLPFGGQLYCLVEFEDEVRLLVLDPKNGDLLWSQTLAQVDPISTIALDPHRRLAGLSPSIADGIMVCPTAAGTVIAIDPATRMLLWVYRYQEPAPYDPQTAQRLAMLQVPRNPATMVVPDRWLDANLTIADGRALLTARDLDEIHCLNLSDGTLQWKRPRGEGAYVGGIYDDKVIIIGRRQVDAFNLADGSPAWSQSAPIPAPSGRGLLIGRLYHLPLSSGEIATIDLASGRTLVRQKTPGGVPMGNLVSSPAGVVSQRFDSLSGFRPLNPDAVRPAAEAGEETAASLNLRGRARLAQGDLAAGLADLRTSLKLEPDPELKGILFENLLDGLRTDFAANQGVLPELEALIDQPEQRARFYRQIAVGMQQSGKTAEAFDVLLKLVDSAPAPSGLEQIDSLVSIRRDRWVGTQLAELFAHASGDAKEKMDQEIRKRLQAARDGKDVDAVRAFLNCFGSHPAADDARLWLVDAIRPVGLSLETERLLRRLQSSESVEHAGFATAKLAALLRETERPGDAAFALRELGGRFADVRCVDGKTGRQLLDEWSDRPYAMRDLASVWPVGPVEINRKPITHVNQFKLPIPIDGNREPFFTDFGIALDQRQQGMVVGTDERGQESWKIDIGQNPQPFGTYAKVRDHLAMLCIGQQVLAVDTLGNPLDRTVKIVWKEDLLEAVPGTPRNLGGTYSPIPLAGGGVRFVLTNHNGQGLGSIGPVGREGVCLQRGRQIMLLDPQTGKPLWQRRGMPPGSELVGDDELLIVVPPESNEVMVLRQGDGQLLGTRPIPAGKQRLALFDRFFLSATRSNQERTLSLLDLWSRETLWEKEFAAGSKIVMVEHDEVAIVEPDGRLSLLRVRDGKPVIESRIDVRHDFTDVVVIRSDEHYVVLTGVVIQPNPQIPILPIGQNPVAAPVIEGEAHGFERATGRKIWTVPVFRQCVDPNQPRNLPILVLATRSRRQAPAQNGQQMPLWDLHLQCLDKRTGNVLLDATEPSQLHQLDVKADPEKKTISISAPMGLPSSFELTYAPHSN